MYREELLRRRLTIERQVAVLKEELTLLDRILQLHPGEGEPKPEAEGAANPKPYAGMSASQAIAHFLSGRRYQFTIAREIYRALLAGGIQTESRRFDNVVYNECDRMVVRGDLEVGKKDGKKAYRLKGPNEE